MIMLTSYLVIWILSLSTSNFIYAWLIMELMSWVLSIWLRNFEMMLSFLIWQSISGLVFLYAFMVFQSSVLVVLAILMKTGLPPFSNWITNLKWTWISWFLFLTTHKFLPFLILVTVSGSMFLILFFPLYSMVSFFFDFSFFKMMLISGITDSAWICLSFKLNYFWAYMLAYSMLWLLWSFSVNWFVNVKSSNSFIFLVLMGLPPFVMFFLKVLIWLHVNLLVGLVLTMATWFILTNYLIWIILNFFNQSMISKSETSWIWCSVLPVLSIMVI